MPFDERGKVFIFPNDTSRSVNYYDEQEGWKTWTSGQPNTNTGHVVRDVGYSVGPRFNYGLTQDLASASAPLFKEFVDEQRAQRERAQLAQTQADVRELREQISGLARMVAQLVPAIANLQPQSPGQPQLPPAGTPAGLLPPVGGLVPARRPLFGSSTAPAQRVLTPEVLPPAPPALVPTEPIVHSDTRRTVIKYPDGTTRTVGETEDRTTIDPITGSRSLETTTHRYMSDDGYLLQEDGNIYACSRCDKTGLARIQHCYACERPLCWSCVSTTTSPENDVIVHCSRHRPPSAQSESWFDRIFGDLDW